jgi:Holliday junction DNA helicase RuvA
MFSYIKGEVTLKSNNFIAIDINGVGYKIYMTEKEISEIEIGDQVKVYTYMRVKDDDISLFGFLTNEELTMFELLISVGGIGAKSATQILSNIEPSDFALSVITEDVSKLKKLPGIGAKTAQRIILELKDKIKTSQAVKGEEAEIKKAPKNQNVQDAMDALQVLGYNHKSIEKAFERIDTKDKNVEELIKQGLKELSN